MKAYVIACSLLCLPAALGGCEPVELTTPIVGDCDSSTSLNRWPQFEGEAPTADVTGFGIGDVPPNFQLRDQFDEPICLWQLAGKVVLVDASAVHCGPCKDIAKHSACVADSYGGELVYLTFITQDKAGGKATLEDAQWWSDTFSLGNGSLTPVVSDGDTVFTQTAEWVPAAPSFMLLDRDMRIVSKASGRSGERVMRDKATELLGEPTDECLPAEEEE
ncbi:MAG: TlpA family protein disulfide reductase [Myxococcota bacterium]